MLLCKLHTVVCIGEINRKKGVRGRKLFGLLGKVMKGRKVPVNVKIWFHSDISFLTLTYLNWICANGTLIGVQWSVIQIVEVECGLNESGRGMLVRDVLNGREIEVVNCWVLKWLDKILLFCVAIGRKRMSVNDTGEKM